MEGAKNRRTYYVQPLAAPAGAKKQEPSSDNYQDAIPDERLAVTLGENSKTNTESPRK
jgi:hypothetical protein